MAGSIECFLLGIDPPQEELHLRQAKVALEAEVARLNDEYRQIREEREREKALFDEVRTIAWLGDVLSWCRDSLAMYGSPRETASGGAAPETAAEETPRNPAPATAPASGGGVLHMPLPAAGSLPGVGEGPRFAFGEHLAASGKVLVVPQTRLDLANEPVFVAGDIHGDAEALRWALDTALGGSETSKLVFLGDLFDRREPEAMLETVRLFTWAIYAFPGRILWIKGNHDLLSFNPATGQFASATVPHEFADFLNQNPGSAVAREGERLCEIIEELPVAAVLGDVWLSHGGVLQNDEEGTGSFTSFDNLTDAMMDDFMWSRMVDAPAKLPSRAHRGAQVGFRDALEFANALKEKTGIEVKHVVCAHQHLDDGESTGCASFSRNWSPELSCQCVSTFSRENVIGEFVRPALLRLVPGGAPEVVVRETLQEV